MEVQTHLKIYLKTIQAEDHPFQEVHSELEVEMAWALGQTMRSEYFHASSR